LDKQKRGRIALVLFVLIPIGLYFLWSKAEETFIPLEYMGSYYADTSLLADKALIDSTLNDNFYVTGDSIMEIWSLRDFELTDQTGNPISLKTFENKILVTNFFYATCPELCPRMNNNLRLAVEAFKDDPEVAFLSHTVHPEHDSVPVLAEYAKKYNYAPDKWYFATGFKHEIYDLAINHYHAAAPSPDGKYDFIHSTMAFLVDKELRIRGYFESHNNPTFATDVKNGIKGLQAEYAIKEKKANDQKR